jgi:hypothetical protein
MQDDIAKQMAEIQAQGERQEQQMMMRQMRNYLAGALCTICGEPLGHDEEIVQDDEDRTMHKRCVPAE